MARKPIVYTLIFLLATGFLSVKIYTIENTRGVMKEDLIELSKVKYGLFSVDEWKKILARIITKKVEELNLEGTNKAAMRTKISAFLLKVINDFEARYYKQKSKSILGILEGTVTSVFGAFDTIRKDIPQFTDQILDFMNDPQNRKAVRGYIIEKLNQYADSTFSRIDYAQHDRIIAMYKFPDREATIQGLTSRIQEADHENNLYKIILISLVALASLLVIFVKTFSKIDYLVLIAASFILLITGLVLPMLEIDARISSMRFTLLGEAVSFNDQVLYYKCKSIIEVVRLMLTQSRLDVFIVGILVLIFSVVFPVSKLAASVLYLFIEKIRTNAVVRFMIFKTGKWSMADVMVIAIFMSYIGFSGIITEQLKQIENLAGSIDILTTNQSRLLTGFFSFTSFAVFSLLISHKLELESKHLAN